MLKMYLQDIKWVDNEAAMLIFVNTKDGGRMNVEVPEAIGFDLRTILNQKLSGFIPYFGIYELIKQLGGKVEKLMIRGSYNPGSAGMLLNINGKSTEIILFYADIAAISIILGLPIYFDNAICAKRELPLSARLLWTRTESITNFSFDTGN
jgi:hypothetical protein